MAAPAELHIAPQALPADSPPFVESDFAIVEAEALPHFARVVAMLTMHSKARFAVTSAIAGCCCYRFAKADILISAMAAPVLPLVVLGVSAFAEFGVRSMLCLALQWRAVWAQKCALLADVAGDGANVPAELSLELRCPTEEVWRHRASFGVTPLWFQRSPTTGWLWSSDLTRWQSVAEPRRCVGGFGAGDLPVPSNQWLLRRLHLRDELERIRPGRMLRAPPPLVLPAELPSPVPPNVSPADSDPSMPTVAVAASAPPLGHQLMQAPVLATS